jgi:hypothetical protein
VEADWSVEIGAGLPVISVPWEGFIDLHRNPSRIREIAEVVSHPVLAHALEILNAASSPVFTSKCDCWPLPADEIDPLEFDAGREEAQQGVGCYIDVVAQKPSLFASFTAHEEWVRTATHRLRTLPQRQARADLVVRRAFVDEQEGCGITLYVAACAASEAGACVVLQTALDHAIAATIESATTGE